MIIVTNSFDYVPVLVDPKKLDDFWRKDSLYISLWGSPPKENWFLKDDDGRKIALIAGLASLDDKNSIGFTNGRHRTRWLLELGMDVVPVCVPHYEIERWVDAEIIVQTKNPIRVRSLKILLGG